jgi:subtilisin family serine protease
VLTGLGPAQSAMLGDPGICVAVLDGPVDLSHPCFAGANVRRLDTLVGDPAGRGRMSLHGTHVASLIFGQPGSPMFGIAPKCRSLILPIFRDIREGHLPQLDLARAIEQAVQEGGSTTFANRMDRVLSALDIVLSVLTRTPDKQDHAPCEEDS